jgi:hypothetical protein
MLSDYVFLTGMKRLTDAFPDYSLADGTVELYRERLEHLTDMEFEDAVNRHIDTYKWFPKVSELLATQRAARPTARESWQRLLTTADQTGEKPEDLTPAEKRALEAIGGWETFSFMPFDSLRFAFRDFEKVFNEAQSAGDLPAIGQGPAPKRLEG